MIAKITYKDSKGKVIEEQWECQKCFKLYFEKALAEACCNNEVLLNKRNKNIIINKKEETLKMTEEDFLNKKAGSLEPKKLEPKEVQVSNVRIDDIQNKYKKAVFTVIHPDSIEVVELSSITFLKDRKVGTVGAWIKLDEVGDFQKGTALAILLEYYKLSSLKDILGKKIMTELDDKKYLTIKAY
jgi:hypothetical protein